MTEGGCFSVDYGRRIADVILRINWKYAEAFEKTAREDQVERGYVSVRMMGIQKRWNDEIITTCQELMGAINATVAEYQRIAFDAVACNPNPTVVHSKEDK